MYSGGVVTLLCPALSGGTCRKANVTAMYQQASGAVAKSSHICSSTFLFLGGQSVECRTLHFSAQAKPAHAESVIFVYGKQTCSGFVVLGRLFQAVFGSNSAFPNRPSASRLHSFRILNAVARIKRRVSLLVFTRVRNLPNP